MASLNIRVEHGSHQRLERLHEKVLEAVNAAGLDANVKKGTSSGGMSVHHEPEMRINGRRVAEPEAMTATGLTRLLKMAHDGSLAGRDEPLSLAFSERFRATGSESEVDNVAITEMIDDATGKRYVTMNDTGKPRVA